MSEFSWGPTNPTSGSGSTSVVSGTTGPWTWSWPPVDYTLSRVRSICEALTAKAITRKEAREMLAALDPSFARILNPQ